jgi:glutamine synthetase
VLAVPALQAADKLLLTKEVISGVVRQAGLLLLLLLLFLPRAHQRC